MAETGKGWPDDLRGPAAFLIPWARRIREEGGTPISECIQETLLFVKRIGGQAMHKCTILSSSAVMREAQTDVKRGTDRDPIPVTTDIRAGIPFHLWQQSGNMHIEGQKCECDYASKKKWTMRLTKTIPTALCGVDSTPFTTRKQETAPNFDHRRGRALHEQTQITVSCLVRYRPSRFRTSEP